MTIGLPARAVETRSFTDAPVYRASVHRRARLPTRHDPTYRYQRARHRAFVTEP
jgi:hypothetical protein